MTPPRPTVREAEAYALLREAMRRLEGVGLDPAHGRHGSVQSEQGAVGILQTAIEAVAAERGILAEIRIFPERGWCELEAFLRRSPDDVPFRAPINVKITSGKAADNVNARIGLLWAFHGIYPGDEASESLLSKDAGFYAIIQGEGAVDAGLADNADYYFAVFFKDQDGISREGNLFSLKRLTHVQANASNPPFQVHWGKEHAAASRAQASRLFRRFQVHWGKEHAAAPLLGPDPAALPWDEAARRLLGAMVESDLLAAKRAAYHRAGRFLPDAAAVLRQEAADATEDLVARLRRRRSAPDAA